MKKHHFVILFSLLTLQSLNGQTLEYDVIRNGKSMGKTLVKRTYESGKTIYHLRTDTEFRVLFAFKVHYELTETFQDGYLLEGWGYNTLNDSEQSRISIKKLDEGYMLSADGEVTRINHDKIVDSVSEIYFEEPFDGKQVYSGYFSDFLSFQEIGNHTYELSSPDGINTYVYENGICTRVDVSRDFASFYFELKPEGLAAVRNKKIVAN